MDKPPKKLLDQVRDLIRLKHYSIRTEQAYISWIKRYIYFHKKRHPKEMGNQEIEAFLTHLAVNLKVASSTKGVRYTITMRFKGNRIKFEVSGWEIYSSPSKYSSGGWRSQPDGIIRRYKRKNGSSTMFKTMMDNLLAEINTLATSIKNQEIVETIESQDW